MIIRDLVSYRLATEADAYDLACFGSESFVDAFGYSVPVVPMSLYVVRTFSRERQLAELRDPCAWTMLAIREEMEIAGAALVRHRDPPGGHSPEEPWAEIARFFLAKMYWRTGVSGDLMVATLHRIRDRGGDLVWLQVWEGAENAIAFYTKWGFRVVGETPFLLGTLEQRDLVMTRSVQPPRVSAAEKRRRHQRV